MGKLCRPTGPSFLSAHVQSLRLNNIGVREDRRSIL
uniref:Uncharacterized protein n=1 Tax=Anguilla anguilla TaxID=7936 RepID=A0A0E9PZQ8_ANGAN